MSRRNLFLVSHVRSLNRESSHRVPPMLRAITTMQIIMFHAQSLFVCIYGSSGYYRSISQRLRAYFALIDKTTTSIVSIQHSSLTKSVCV